MTKAIPVPDGVTDFYWSAARRGELAVTACVPHGHLTFPPDVSCPFCGAREVEPRTVSGRGTVYSFTVVRQAFDEAFVDDVPYVLALVELEEQAGLCVLTNLVDVDPDTVEVGTPVRVVFEPRGDWMLPQFTPARGRS
jgi:uncharacterized OB-fold protein